MKKKMCCYINMIVTISVMIASAVCGGTVNPYVADAETLHLWHFDGSASPAVDSAGSENLTLNGGASLGSTAFNGFGTAMDVATAPGDDNRADGSQDIAPTNLVVNAETGAFTFEALVRPTVALDSVTASMQIISMDDETGTGKRSFQFAIGSGGKLKFINIAGGSPASADIPTNGANAYVEGEWFHVAITYSGDQTASGNFRYY